MADYTHALQALHRVPLARFVAERTRLAAQLRAAGDEEGANQLVRRRRPTTSAWTVNQLYWDARDAFDALLASAARIRSGDLGATRAYRETLGELRKRAATILGDAAPAATEPTLRRVTATLAAVAAAGGFEPDDPGTLAVDRAPPGFDVLDASASTAHLEARRGSSRQRPVAARAAASERARVAAARAEELERKKAERKAREAERQRLQKSLRDAQAAVREREGASSLLRKELHASEKAVEDARGIVRDLERQLDALDDAD